TALSVENLLGAADGFDRRRRKSVSLSPDSFSQDNCGASLAHAAAGADHRAGHAERNSVCRVHFVRSGPGPEGRYRDADLATMVLHTCCAVAEEYSAYRLARLRGVRGDSSAHLLLLFS